MKLPAPDAIWSATVGPADRPPQAASLEQKAATERARAYIAETLPAPGADLIKILERQAFFCRHDGDEVFECIYSKAQARVPCATPLRVSIQVHFPYEADRAVTVSKDNIDVAAFVAADPDQVDHRGCFPL